jgi:UDP-2,4-diacetamido-2,4,6-trideoxy-beta-L-altropyranose hydrolase
VINEKISTIMVLMGATDARNLTLKLAEFLHLNFPKLKKKIVIGAGCRDTDLILKSKAASTEILQNIDALHMKDLMLDADIAISACGTTLYELACVGTPTIGIGIADNQKLNIEHFSAIGFLVFAGWWNEPSLFSRIVTELKNLEKFKKRSTISSIGRNLVSGHGAFEVVRRLKMAWYMKKLYFLRATPELCDLFYEWVNDAETRKNSFNPEKISYDTHVEWYKRHIESRNCLMVVGYIGEIPVGQLRVDIEHDVGIVSYSIAPAWRGKSLGILFLQEIPAILEKYQMTPREIMGKVQKNNIASQKSFIRTGFERKEKKDWIEYHKRLKLLNLR